MAINRERHKRPDPAELLRQIEADEQRENRGKLKIFFGSSAGVGKTYAMLSEARRDLAGGIDVLAGIIETHQRPETKKILEGLPELPRLEVDHRGVKVSEFDLDAALKRKPAILLVDELAHTNAPGCRHPKRWQDVEELLDAGIDVYTTLNVQHLESLNDVVESITGIPVRETIPDGFFDSADDITLVDIPPDELLDRLKAGKVYIAPGANERAIQNFFKKTNLLSLRELALRRTAAYVDVDTDEQRRREGLSTPNSAGDRIMVCIGPDLFASKLVRTGKRLASALKAPWTVVYVETNKASALNSRLKQHVQQALQSAERNGATIITLEGAKIGDELVEYARSKGISKIIIGKSIRSYWKHFGHHNLAEFVIAHSGDIDVYVVTTPAAAVMVENLSSKRAWKIPSIRIGDYLLAILLVAGCTAFGHFFKQLLSHDSDVIMVYMVGAVVAATWLGRGPALLYAVISPGFLNYFFIEPLYTLQMYDSSYWLTLLVMFFSSFLISSLAAKLREQMLFSRRRERETQLFYNLTKQLSVAQDEKIMAEDLENCIAEALQSETNIWFPDDKGTLIMHKGSVVECQVKEASAARWCFEHREQAGLGTNTMPSAMHFYLPITGTRSALGVLGVMPRSGQDAYLPDQVIMLKTFAGLIASALERLRTAEIAEKTNVLIEKEKLRNILLSSVSHDLRSPLAAIMGAADTLIQQETKSELPGSIRKEAGRLSKIINNLLDITRIEGGQLQLHMQPYYPAEIIGTAVDACRILMKDHKLSLHVNGALPLMRMDGTLISQVIQNLLENVATHTPSGTTVDIQADLVEDNFKIIVSDNGPGIPIGQGKEIFNKFATFSHGDKPKGTGLGLAICQAIVMAHSGHIRAENKPEGGARFVIELPLSQVQENEP
jgi:two-component system sensor histidine kinase KdpD